MATPAFFRRYDYSIVTPAKNQGNCGFCWAFASVGALESHLIKAGLADPEDLSEQQQVSCNNAMLGCDGGSSTAIRYWQNKGPENEDYFPYTAEDATPCDEGELLGYRVTDFHTVPISTADFKESLYIDGPSYWRFTVYSDFDTYWDGGSPGTVYISQQGATYRGGHAVLLIGWDDDKGAFLCKNSWGENGGPNGDGTFWIAYTGHFNNLGFGMANFSVLSLQECSYDSDCDDGVFCNGSEICNGGICQTGSLPCLDDQDYCNGEEICNETLDQCEHTGDPCGDGYHCITNFGCVPDTCGAGKGTCDEGEDCNNCPGDCISGSGGGSCGDCFKGTCDGVCHPVKDGQDCADCAPAYCCGDGVCSGAENSDNCAIDCGTQPSSEAGYCSDKVDNDGDGFTDCDDPDCDSDKACDEDECLVTGTTCTANEQCCSGRCHPRKGCL